MNNINAVISHLWAYYYGSMVFWGQGGCAGVRRRRAAWSAAAAAPPPTGTALCSSAALTSAATLPSARSRLDRNLQPAPYYLFNIPIRRIHISC